MAHYNEILAARFNSILNKLLSMKEGAPAPSLSSDIVPTIQLEGDRPEYAFLGGVRLCAGFVGVAAGGAGNRSVALLRNPATSGVIVVVEAIVLHSTVASKTFVIRNAVTGGVTATGSRVRDSRWGTMVPAALVQSTNGAAATGNIVGFWPGQSNGTATSGRIDVPFVITPNESLAIEPGVDNEGVSAGFFWRERAVEPSELR